MSYDELIGRAAIEAGFASDIASIDRRTAEVLAAARARRAEALRVYREPEPGDEPDPDELVRWKPDEAEQAAIKAAAAAECGLTVDNLSVRSPLISWVKLRQGGFLLPPGGFLELEVVYRYAPAGVLATVLCYPSGPRLARLEGAKRRDYPVRL